MRAEQELANRAADLEHEQRRKKDNDRSSKMASDDGVGGGSTWLERDEDRRKGGIGQFVNDLFF